jgi:hypothetical protein
LQAGKRGTSRFGKHRYDTVVKYEVAWILSDRKLDQDSQTKTQLKHTGMEQGLAAETKLPALKGPNEETMMDAQTI